MCFGFHLVLMSVFFECFHRFGGMFGRRFKRVNLNVGGRVSAFMISPGLWVGVWVGVPKQRSAVDQLRCNFGSNVVSSQRLALFPPASQRLAL